MLKCWCTVCTQGPKVLLCLFQEKCVKKVEYLCFMSLQFAFLGGGKFTKKRIFYNNINFYTYLIFKLYLYPKKPCVQIEGLTLSARSPNFLIIYLHNVQCNRQVRSKQCIGRLNECLNILKRLKEGIFITFSKIHCIKIFTQQIEVWHEVK